MGVEGVQAGGAASQPATVGPPPDGPAAVVDGRRAAGSSATGGAIATPSRLGSMPLRSDEVEDILSAMPGGLLRWGIAAVTVTFAIILAGMWFIRYPEVLEGRLSVVSDTPPVPVIARTDGKVVRLMANENDLVARGQPLVVLESTADPDDMNALERELVSFRERWFQDPASTVQLTFAPGARVGPAQQAYSAFLQAREDLRFHVLDDPFPERLRRVEQQIRSHERLDGGLVQQETILKQEAEVVQARLAADRELLSKGALSGLTVQDSQRDLLHQNALLESARAERLKNESLLAQYRREHAELGQERRLRRRALEKAVGDALHSLSASVADYRYRFVLTAPTAGRLSFFDVWTPDQHLRAGKEVMFVVPEEGRVLGRMALSQRGIGRVRPGNRVRVSFDSYPVQQFGAVRAEVVSISGTSRDAEHVVTLAFPAGLVTNYQTRLRFRQGMSGSASVITEDIRLLVRAFAPLRYLLQRMTEES